MTQLTQPRPNKNWLLIQFRKWHSWGGVFLSLFIMIVAFTGIMLNHKDLFFHSREERSAKADGPSGLLTSSTDLTALPITFANALNLARDHFGEGSLEKVELKDEHGWLIYKVVRGKGEELIIDARTGEMSTKYGIKVATSPAVAGLQASAAPVAGGPRRGLNWAKIVDDLHTGQLYGSYGRLLVDFTSIVIIGLTLSGLYLWGVPILRKKQSQQKKQAVQALASQSSPPVMVRPASGLPEAMRRPAQRREPVEPQPVETV